MLRLDRNDPLDRMIIQELNGEPVLFDQWLDAMDELAEEPECAEILEEKGLEREDVLREAKAYRDGFHARLAARELPVDDRFLLCQLLSEQAQAEPSMELLRIYAEILSDPGLLLDEEPQAEDEEDRLLCEDQMILQYLSLQEDRDQLLRTLTQRGELAGKFDEVKKQKAVHGLWTAIRVERMKFYSVFCPCLRCRSRARPKSCWTICPTICRSRRHRRC